MAYVWVIEMKHETRKQWCPTVGCALTREDAQREWNDWRKDNPSDCFRIRKYVRQAEAPKGEK